MATYSQHNEDHIILNLFHNKTTGFYLDVGAFEPHFMSNTQLLYENGWRGINVEPQKDKIPMFIEHRPEDMTIAKAVVRDKNVEPFVSLGIYDEVGGQSTLYPGMVDNARKNLTKSNEYAVPTTTLKEICDLEIVQKRNYDIDLLDIDIELGEYEALMGMPWSYCRPKLILIEWSSQGELYEQIFRENNYFRASILDNYCNKYMISSESSCGIANFASPADNFVDFDCLSDVDTMVLGFDTGNDKLKLAKCDNYTIETLERCSDTSIIMKLQGDGIEKSIAFYDFNLHDAEAITILNEENIVLYEDL